MTDEQVLANLEHAGRLLAEYVHAHDLAVVREAERCERQVLRALGREEG